MKFIGCILKAVRRVLWSRQHGYAVWVPGEGGVSWHQARYAMQAIDKEMQRRRLDVWSAWDFLGECETRQMTRLEWEEMMLEVG